MRDKAKEKKIAKERVEILFKEADKVFDEDKELANRYVTLARKVAMKSNVKIARHYKRRFCKHCYKYLRPGINCRVRTKKNKSIYYCLNCKKYMRFPFLKETRKVS